MKQVILQKGKVKLESVPCPVVSDHHVLVEVAYSLISTGTELGSLSESRKSLITKAIKQPEKLIKLRNYLQNQGVRKTVDVILAKLSEEHPLGYSCSGVVKQIGRGVESIQVGDFVACAGAGYANHAEIVLVPKNLVVKVPDGCSLKDASSVALGSIALQGIRRAEVRLGENVAVIGLGLLGQLTIQLLKQAGCRVIGVELDNYRLEIAKSFGLEIAINPLETNLYSEVIHFTDGYGVDATIITAASNSDEIVQQAMEITRKKGKVVVVGAVGLGLKRSPFYEKEIDFLISCSYGPGRYDERYEVKSVDYPYAYVRWTENRNMLAYLRLVAEKKIILDSIIEREYRLEDASKAYEELQSGNPKPLGVVLRYSTNETDKKYETKVVYKLSRENHQLGVALIGAGNFAKMVHLPNLKRLSHIYRLRAVVSKTGINTSSLAKKYKVDYITTDYQEVLQDEKIDVVMICTRHHLHAQQAIQTAQAGKAVFLEKPMALNREELDELLAVLTQTKVPFMVGFNRRFSPAATRVKEIPRKRTNPIVIIYRVNAGYIPLDNWVQGEEGGGRIIGEACHMFDLFNYFVGFEVSSVDINAISPASAHILARDNFVTTLKYVDGSVCTLIYTALGCAEMPKEHLEIYCDGKILVIDDFTELRIYGSKEKGWKGLQDKGHLQELALFGSFVKNQSQVPISLQELISATEISFVAEMQLAGKAIVNAL